MATVNQDSTAFLTITFLDKDGSPQVPTSAKWEAFDVVTKTTLQELTDLPLAESIELILKPEINALVDAAKKEEEHRIIIRAEYGADDKFNEIYNYKVRRVDV